MKQFLIGVLLAILLSVFGQDYIRQRKRVTELSEALTKLESLVGQAGQSYGWLSEPVLEAGDKKYSRAQLLDLILVKALHGHTQDAK